MQADSVALVTVPPVIVGVAIVGDVPKTAAPVPVSSVRAASRFADEGVPRKVATPVPSPVTPVLIGKPVQLVNSPEAGVPSVGFEKVGLASTTPLGNVGAARNVQAPETT